MRCAALLATLPPTSDRRPIVSATLSALHAIHFGSLRGVVCVDGVTDTEARKLLRSVVVSSNRAAALLRLGAHLRRIGLFPAALDVYESVGRFAATEEERGRALLGIAFVLRLERRLSDATEAYGRVLDHPSEVLSLLARLGLARVAANRGNYALADAQIRPILARAREREYREVLTAGLSDAAWIAGNRRRHAEALAYSFDSLAFPGDERDIERAFVNMAWAEREMGRYAWSSRLARRAVDSIGREERESAVTLLLHVAADEGDVNEFKTWARVADSEPMAATSRAERWLAESRLSAMLGDFARAGAAAARMLAIGEADHLAEMIIRADEAIVKLRQGKVPVVFLHAPPRLSREDIETVQEIEEALEELCGINILDASARS